MTTSTPPATPRPVVVGVDGAPASAGALRYAVAVAGRRGAPLHVVHVAGPDSGAESVVRQAALVVHRLAPALSVSTELREGTPAESIVDAARHAQLVVIGRESRSGLDRLLTGVTTATVASNAECAVVVVPASWTAQHPHDRLVAAIKSRDRAYPLLAEAFAEANARSAALTVIHVWELPDPLLDRIELRGHSADRKAAGETLLDELLSEWRSAYPDVSVTTRVEHGHPADLVLAAGGEADLVLISRRRHGFPPQGHLGGVAHAVLRRSDVAVAVVPVAAAANQFVPELVLEESGNLLK